MLSAFPVAAMRNYQFVIDWRYSLGPYRNHRDCMMMRGRRCLNRPWWFRFGGMKEASPGLAQSHYGFSNDGEASRGTRNDRPVARWAIQGM
jgi:hypothetical protein